MSRACGPRACLTPTASPEPCARASRSARTAYSGSGPTAACLSAADRACAQPGPHIVQRYSLPHVAAESRGGHGHEQRVQDGLLGCLNRGLEEQVEILFGNGVVRAGCAERQRVVAATPGEVRASACHPGERPPRDPFKLTGV